MSTLKKGPEATGGPRPQCAPLVCPAGQDRQQWVSLEGKQRMVRFASVFQYCQPIEQDFPLCNQVCCTQRRLQ